MRVNHIYTKKIVKNNGQSELGHKNCQTDKKHKQ